MHIAALVESTDHVCCRYRLRAFDAALTRAGHTLHLHSIPKPVWGRGALLSQLGDADVVVLQRKLLPRWQLALLRRRSRRLVFDIDDAVFLRDSYSRKSVASLGRWRRFRATVRSCDAVVCGNDWLAAAANEAGARETVVVPTCIDPARYPISQQQGTPVRLVWIGSSSTLQGVERIGSTLDAVAAAIPNIVLKVICDRFPSFDRMPIEPCHWRESTEAAELAEADIGIASIPDDDWSRGKCGLKVLQYMAAGLPVVANPVGVHTTMVRHGETGYHAHTVDDWIQAIGRLAADRQMRANMGRAARSDVERKYSLARGATQWIDLLAPWSLDERRIA